MQLASKIVTYSSNHFLEVGFWNPELAEHMPKEDSSAARVTQTWTW